jgi:hypothetical protein
VYASRVVSVAYARNPDLSRDEYPLDFLAE